ncbi:ATP-binding cassette domain-containing protein [Mycobacterium intracellulare]|uniref:ATP-binding cassette domain-containing protein n=5 Tax=Mycobacterium intracellulare TaxID=1767 RepID=UPI000448B600|nr:ATP-binding cassette domain-containing protein [Mycobacterium intracellulare]ARV83648.1 ABC transporter ATP-binding protein [Mycobacterium intracellulare subsp. chimaera]ETZ29002.1 ABC transporter family protein [Mycobacterium intracellulare MIN_052511_1280]MCA2349977.1 ATP-binding cassette domain-containing protein [Mycobacterium intracellulare subsp. chimaera]MCV7325901.1 ATP-binding cassette domain-containing protein [Mycobacterium intracellulare subsp. chimaera]MDM3905780.1 ATP-binding 
MSRPAPPVLTVQSEWSQRSFAPGHDIVVGSDLRADMRVAHPLIARAHLLLRFDGAKWVAIDNGSPSGVFVNGHRVRAVDIHDRQSLNLARPDGPRLSFGIGRHDGAVGQLPPTLEAVPVIAPPGAPKTARPEPPRRPGVPPPRIARPQPAPPRYPPAGQPPRAPHPAPQPAGLQPLTEIGAQTLEASGFDSANLRRAVQRSRSKLGAPPAGAAVIGRAEDSDIVISDVLASRHHAYLVPGPTGMEIHDAQSINGTFVNGTRILSAPLTEGDVVTIGNVDLVFNGEILLRRAEAATRTGGLEVREVDFHVDNKRLIQKVSLTARPGTLTALIGGSGAGKSTLSRLIAGATCPTSGSITFEGHDIHAQFASLRSRIGMVPQDDVVHRQLTVTQALNYAAELRLPTDTSKSDRAQVVAQVIEELGLTKHADTRVDKLSGGQRKRASVALELLTGPSLLILDEPTSGLDPALDLQVMTMLRQLADAGRVVLVVTHSLSYLDLCDQVLLMAPGGKTAYCGPPGDIEATMGTTNWAKIFGMVGADPDEANRRFLAQAKPPPPVSDADKPADLGAPARSSTWRQFSTIARRQVRLIVADRAYFIFLALLPFVMGALALTVPGSTGFRVADPNGDGSDEPGSVLMLLTMAAVFMGTALTIRDLIGERPIFRREQAVGLSTKAYLLAKMAVFFVFAIVQSTIATTITILGKGAPTRPALLLGSATLELYVATAAMCVAAAMIGLVLSSLARSNEQIMPLLVVSLMLQLVLCGGMVPVTDRIGLDQMSWAVPSRWGYAAQASTVDLWTIEPGPLAPKDRHFKHTAGTWLFDVGMLVLLTVVYAGIVGWRSRLKRH